MSSIFLRIYGGLLFSLILVAVLSGIVVTIINGLRVADYREDMARATFRLVSDTLAGLPGEQHQQWLQAWSHKLSIPFVVTPVADVEGKTLERLSKGEVAVQMLTERSATVTSWINDQWLLQGQVADVSEQMISGTIILLRHLLNAYPAEDRARVLAHYDAFSYPVNIVDYPITQLTPVQQHELHQGGIITVLNLSNETLQLYAQLNDKNQILHLGPVKLLNLYPFKLTLTLGLSFLSGSMLAVPTLLADWHGLSTPWPIIFSDCSACKKR